MTRALILALSLALGCSSDPAPEHPDCGTLEDACVHVAAPLGPGPFTGCTCGDVLRVRADNPDLVECVTP